MSFLTMIQDTALSLGLINQASDLTTVIDSTDPTINQLRALADKEGKNLGGRFDWERMTPEATFIVTNNELQGTFVSIAGTDYKHIINSTLWDRNNSRPIRGSITKQRWALLKGSTAAGTFSEYQERDQSLFSIPAPANKFNFTIDQFDADGLSITVTLTDDSTVTFTEASEWADGVDNDSTAAAITSAINVNASLSANAVGSIITVATSGVRNLTFVGSSSWATVGNTGGIWAFFFKSKNWCQSSSSVGQQKWAADTDTGLLDEDLMSLGIEWRYLKAKGFDYSEEFVTYERSVQEEMSHDRGHPIINLETSRIGGPGVLGVPEGSWPAS